MAKAYALPIPIRDEWNPDTCPLPLLPYLAMAWHVDEWDDGWEEGRKRGAIKESLLLHRRKGTVWAVKRIMTRLGFASAKLQEGEPTFKRDGTVLRDGSHKHGDYTNWAKYRIYVVNRPIATHEGENLRRALIQVAPARCQLVEINFIAAPLKHNGNAKRDGMYKRGAIL